MRKWLCIICGWIYDEAKGWPSDGIAPGTKWEDIPEDWMCPECNVGKSDFEMLDITDLDLEDNHLSDAIDSLEPVVIIGSGHAGYHVAASLRSQSPDLSITVFTADDGAQYSKPSISNALALKKDGDSLVREHALHWENRLNIRLYPHTKVTKIDRSNKKIQTTIGEHSYGKLVIATGAKPIIVPIEGDISGVVSVNDLADYRVFRQKISNKQHVTILGDGLIGCEFANDLAASGIKVTVVGRGKWVMERLIPEPLAVALQSALREIGVEWKLENSISSITSINGRYYLQLSDGQSLETDIVLSAVGLRPNIQLAQEAGLRTMNGICTGLDHRSSDPTIFALGDCAEVDGHWAPYISPITQAIPSLVNNLLDQPTEASITSAPIIVKTPILPLTILPASEPGQWITEEYEGELAAGYYNYKGKLTGFSLLGHQLQHRRMEWMSKLSS